MKVVPITDAKGRIIAGERLAASEAVHRQLRPHLPPGYVKRMKEVFASGAEMAVAVDRGRVVGITVFRVIERTFTGRELYCDDLVSDEARRSTGIGHALIEYMRGIVRARRCDTFTLDSGTQRQQAHKFYFREGMTITSFHFTMAKRA